MQWNLDNDADLDLSRHDLKENRTSESINTEDKLTDEQACESTPRDTGSSNAGPEAAVTGGNE